MTETNVMQQEDEVPPCLADLTIGALGNLNRGLTNYNDSKFARTAAHSFRKKMIGAHRFELTSELIHAVTLVASSLDVPTLSVMIENARPCFDSMWIEWDEQERREASLAIQRKVYGREVNAPPASEFCDRAGYLIQDVRILNSLKSDWDNLHPRSSLNGYEPESTLLGRVTEHPIRLPDSTFFYTGVSFLSDTGPAYQPASYRGNAGSFKQRVRNLLTVSPVGYLLSNETPLTHDNLKWLLGFALDADGGEEAMAAYLENEGPENRLHVKAGAAEVSAMELFQYDTLVAVLNKEWLANNIRLKSDKRFLKNESQLFQIKSKFWATASHAFDWSLDLHDLKSEAEKNLGKQIFACDLVNNLMNSSVGLIADDLRFLITAMAMLNFTWISADPAQRSDQKKIINGKVVPRNEYRRLRIGLPPKEMEKKIRGVLSGRMPSRQHDVRGHFRKMSSGKRIWIHAHVRGDPSLGIIRKEYVLDKETEDRR